VQISSLKYKDKAEWHKLSVYKIILSPAL